MTSTFQSSDIDDGSVESTQPAERNRRVWWAECTLCGTASCGSAVPVFGSPTKMWATLEGDDYRWTRRDDGRVLCRIHSEVADCDRDGHQIMSWRQHPIEPALQWRYCRTCGMAFEQRRRHPSAVTGVVTDGQYSAVVASAFHIDWDEICRNPYDFERLVKLLLQRLYPDGEIIDGRGGDGGREFQIRTSTSLTLYEAKSFTGRLSRKGPARRPQVERSLVSAAKLQPDAWNLVVPIDHDEAELAWFDELRAGDFPFICYWHGQGWLEERLSQHGDLVRFATENKLLEYVRMYKLETEALTGGVSDLLERHRALDGLGDELSPWWRPAVRRDSSGRLVLALEAKHQDAAEQAPILFKVGLNIPDAPEHDELRAAI